jgi:flagellar hook-associated protein 1 FlgK
MSTFSGLNTALTSLYAQRRGLEVAGQNIANANTAGYTRQQVTLQAAGGPPVPALFSTSTGIGAGVSVTGITRTRDSFLETRGRAEHSQSAYLSSVGQAYGFVEDVFAEPGDTALQAQLSEFWNGWYDVDNNPDDPAVRGQVIQRGQVLAAGLASAQDALASLWGSTRSNLGTVITEVNATAEAVAQLNTTIQRSHAAGLPANELIDQRDVHLVRLAELVGATATARADGTVDVYVAGSSLVAGGSNRELAVAGAGSLDEQRAAASDGDPDTEPVSVRWADNGSPIVAGGLARGAAEILTAVLPGQAQALDGVARALADSVNTAHRAGTGADGLDNRPFFTGTTAATIAVALTHSDQVAASRPGDLADGSNCDDIARLGTSSTGPDAAYRDLVASLGVAAQTAGRKFEIQERVTATVDAARASDAGVNLDEEMTNMLMFQRAYEAAARLMTTVDGMLDVLINRTGLVGR